MVVNEDAGDLTQRGALKLFASKPAPTFGRRSADNIGRLPGRRAVFLMLILGAPLNTLAVIRQGCGG